MKQIRRNVFETNSSSSHAISFSNSKHTLDYTQLVPDSDGVIHCWFDEFGWGYYGEDETNSAQIKLNYLVTQICETNGCPRPWCCKEYELQEAAEAVMETDDFKMLEEDIISTLKEHGIPAEKPTIRITSITPAILSPALFLDFLVIPKKNIILKILPFLISLL